MHPATTTTGQQEPQDTIVAVITPPGRGGIAALRLAGPLARQILSTLVRKRDNAPLPWPPRQMTVGVLRDHVTGALIDEVMAVWLPGPQTYTTLDQAEIFCHGSDTVARQILRECCLLGARVAEAGEFTRLAFEHGRIDLTRAEAVAELIGAQTEKAASVAREHLTGAYREHVEGLRDGVIALLAEFEAAIDFTEQEYYGETPERLLSRVHTLCHRLDNLIATYAYGKRLQDGARVVIAGRTNAGKSSLFNILCRRNRAIVSPIPGTTRDYITEWIELDGLPVEIIDTAGLRTDSDEIERQGQQLAVELLNSANLIIWVVDGSDQEAILALGAETADFKEKRGILARNKSDKGNVTDSIPSAWPLVAISCKNEDGIDNLIRQIVLMLAGRQHTPGEGMIVTSGRHFEKLTTARSRLDAVTTGLNQGSPPEEIVPEVQEAVRAMDEITGKIYSEEVLGAIFGKFCIGK